MSRIAETQDIHGKAREDADRRSAPHPELLDRLIAFLPGLQGEIDLLIRQLGLIQDHKAPSVLTETHMVDDFHWLTPILVFLIYL